MPLILFHSRRVREALKKPAAFGTELFFVCLVASAVGLLVMLARRVNEPFTEKVNISLSLWSLPKYTLLSLGRGFAAYILSLIFTLVYGTVAAHNHRAEKVMVPALDVLQAIPVLGFLPGIVLAMVHLFPSRQLGLELACILMIFTAQVWNMTFSFHGSLRGIPSALREVAVLQNLSGWQVFRMLEVPAAMIGLVWNSMMSMAGGWFFLTVNEAFTLGSHDYRLPGIGSYMNEAINDHNAFAMFAAVIAMITMIIAVDQLFWRPIVVWSQRFKMEDTAEVDKPQSWVLDLLQRSHLYQRVIKLFRRKRAAATTPVAHPATSTTGALSTDYQNAAAPALPSPPDYKPLLTIFSTIAQWTALALIALGAVWGAWHLVILLTALPLLTGNHQDWLHVILALLASFARTSTAVILGAAWTLPVGILIGLSPKWSQRLQPIIQVVASFPAPMVFPLVTGLLLILHIPFTIGCTALMLLGAQWYILFNVIAGATAIPSDLKEITGVYRMGQAQRWLKLYIPCVFPYLVTGLITAAGGAWNATIVSEYVQGANGPTIAFGLGSMISTATTDANYPLLAAGVVTMAIFVVVLNRIVWKRMYRLAEDRYSLNV